MSVPLNLLMEDQEMSGTLMLQDESFSRFPHIPAPRGVQLTTLPSHACPYLPGREAITRAVAARVIDPDIYHEFMNAGFRRSGTMLYQPVCVGCRECRQLRVPTTTFAPTKSQRRSIRRNADVIVQVGDPIATDEKFDLYAKYCARWHKHAEPETREGFERFLYQSPVESIEFTYRVGDRLMAVGICDLCEQSLSSVYFYFDPDEAGRSLGTFGVLCEIDFARKHSIPHWYAGFWIRDCPAMSYKANFGPAEVLGMDGAWRPLPGNAETPLS